MENMLSNSTNLRDQAAALTDYWSPKVVAKLNDQYLKVAKVKGEFEWHDHENEDELFLILDGELTIQYRDKDVLLKSGDFHVVPKGVQHNPRCEEECLLALLEPVATKHTGEMITEKTRSIESQLD